MTSPIRAIILCSFLAPALSLAAQTAEPALTADDIVQKYVNAIGGKDAISKVNSFTMDSTAQIMGSDAPTTTVVLNGVGYRSETEFNGAKMVQVFTDKSGWMINPMAGTSDPQPMPDEQYKFGKGQIFVGGSLYDYAARGSKIELVSKDDKTCKIKLTTKDNVETLYIIDSTTWLVKSMSGKGKMQDQDVDITSSYDDYRKTDAGYLFPYSIAIDFGGQFQLTIAVKKIEFNKTIDPAIFDMPKPAPPPAQPNKPA